MSHQEACLVGRSTSISNIGGRYDPGNQATTKDVLCWPAAELLSF